MAKPNQLQIMSQVRLALGAAGGTVGTFAVKHLGIVPTDWDVDASMAAWLISWAIVGVWAWLANRSANQIANVEQLPEVATVVVKDSANGAIAKLANDDKHPNIVTETQNEKDVKAGAKAA